MAEQTEQRIKELLPQGSVDVDTRMILANAIYFLADWADQFDPDDTYERTFTRLDGTTEQVPTMHLDLNAIEDHRIQTGWTDDARIARLPYQDDEVSMIVVLPHQHDGLPEIDATLDAPTFEGWLQSLGGASDTLGLPRFQAEWELELSDVIADLGAPSLFSDATADLTRMADTDEDLFVTGIFHKAFVKVDEEGTEAAAATGAVVGVESASEPFIVNRPFLFVIQDDLTGAILFTGRITDPLAG